MNSTVVGDNITSAASEITSMKHVAYIMSIALVLNSFLIIILIPLAFKTTTIHNLNMSISLNANATVLTLEWEVVLKTF